MYYQRKIVHIELHVQPHLYISGGIQPLIQERI